MAWIATLWGSGDFPDTQVEIVSTRTECTQCVGPHTHMSEFATIKFPDGTTKEVDHCALIDWSSDWYDTNTGYSGHCDTFSNPRPPHPITGTRYPKGMSPDELQAQKIIEKMT
jgi:hypothetical protein